MRRVFVALALGLMVGISVPVMADHIQEPTTPILGVTLNLTHYATGTPVFCIPVTEGMTWDQFVAASTNPFTLGNMRIEPFVRVAGLPSEHWRTRIIFEKVERGNGGSIAYKDDSYYDWRHQNVPPHGRTNWEVAQSKKNFSGLDGFWRIAVRVVGDESGAIFEPSCVFEVAGA